MKGIWAAIKGFPDRLLNFLCWLTGIPWLIKFLSNKLVMRERFLWAAIVQNVLSLAGVFLLIWITSGVWAAGDKLRITVVILSIILSALKFFDGLQKSYYELKQDALKAEIESVKIEQ